MLCAQNTGHQLGGRLEADLPEIISGQGDICKIEQFPITQKSISITILVMFKLIVWEICQRGGIATSGSMFDMQTFRLLCKILQQSKHLKGRLIKDCITPLR